MAEFTQLYSGKGLSAPLPSDGGRATSRLSDFIVQAEEIKYKAFRENEQEFLKNSNIDPVFLISTKNRDAQMDMLNAFNQKWAQKFKESGYNLSTEDKKALLTEKNFLLANQQDMQAKQDLWLQHRNMIMQNPNKFDAEEWATHDANYRVSGEYDLVAPPIKARSLDMALEENPINSAAIPGEDIQETRSGIKGVRAVTYGGTEEQGRKRVADMILSDEAYAKDVSKQFMSLDEATKLQYLDADKNGAISPEERKNFNPIIKWAQDTKWQKGVKQSLSQWRATPGQTGGGANAGLPTLADFGKPSSKYTPQAASDVGVIGQTPYRTFHKFDTVNSIDLPTGVRYRVLNPSGEKEEVAKGIIITGDLVGYDEERDEFVFIATKDFKGLDTGMSRGKDTRFAVKRSDLNLPQYNNLQVSIGGKNVAIKDIKRTTPVEEEEINIGI